MRKVLTMLLVGAGLAASVSAAFAGDYEGSRFVTTAQPDKLVAVSTATGTTVAADKTTSIQESQRAELK